MRDPSRPWWERPGLETQDGRLLVAGRYAEELARRLGTPLFVYDLVRLEEQARSLVDAFARAGVPFRLRLALKAQRDPQVLAFVRQLGWVGVERGRRARRASAMLARAAAARPVASVTVAGNINEGDDLWAEDLPFPEVHEGDIVAVLGVGTYNQSMHLDHCLRPPASVVAFADRSGAPVR